MSLAGCLLSLARLDFPREEYEVIIVDDGGTNPVRDLADAYSKAMNIRMFRQANGGPGMARNTGAVNARGEVLVFLDDDCRPEPDWLQIFNLFNRHYPGAIVGGSVLNGCPDDMQATASHLWNEYLFAYHNKERGAARFFTSNNMTVPTARFRSLGGFDTKFVTGEDREFLRRWQDSGQMLVYAPEARVWHDRPMSLASFFLQHYRYGKGSRKYHRLYTSSKPESARMMSRLIPEPPSFYVNLIRYPISQVKGPERWRLAGLLLLSQVATLFGAIREQIAGPLPKQAVDADPLCEESEGKQGPLADTLSDQPAVSVVIPTFQRPADVGHALRSALDQTFAQIEVVVVVDGRDSDTIQLLSQFDDPRLRVVVPDKHLGNAGARNLGVQEARAPWIAFLDDDDIWLPDKLDLQLRTAMQAACCYPVISCQVTARHKNREFTWPRRAPRSTEPLSEYLLRRSTPFTGEGLIQTSTVLSPRSLLIDHPFDNSLSRHVDLDWALRIAQLPDCCVLFVPENQPLVIWDIAQNRDRVTTKNDWQASLEWLQKRDNLVTRRAYASFILTQISAIAVSQGAYDAFFPLLREAFKHGSPSLIDLITHVGYFALPARLRDVLASGFEKRTNENTLRP